MKNETATKPKSTLTKQQVIDAIFQKTNRVCDALDSITNNPGQQMSLMLLILNAMMKDAPYTIEKAVVEGMSDISRDALFYTHAFPELPLEKSIAMCESKEEFDFADAS